MKGNDGFVMNMILLRENGDIQPVLVKSDEIHESMCGWIGNGCNAIQNIRMVDAMDFDFPVFLVTDKNGRFLCSPMNLTASMLSGTEVYGNALIATNDGENICGMSKSQVAELTNYLLAIIRNVAHP